MDEVKAVMSDNIEKVLQRGEKLDTLVDKTDNLMSEADRCERARPLGSLGERPLGSLGGWGAAARPLGFPGGGFGGGRMEKRR